MSTLSDWAVDDDACSAEDGTSCMVSGRAGRGCFQRSMLEPRSDVEADELEPARNRLGEEYRRIRSSSPVDFTRVNALSSEGRRACRPGVMGAVARDGVEAADEVDVDGEGGRWIRDADLRGLSGLCNSEPGWDVPAANVCDLILRMTSSLASFNTERFLKVKAPKSSDCASSWCNSVPPGVTTGPALRKGPPPLGCLRVRGDTSSSWKALLAPRWSK
jgi:hypothetical protein